MSKEIELKLFVPQTALQTLLDHPLIAAARVCGEPALVESTYFDTGTLDLYRRGIALRTRRINSETLLQTVKSGGSNFAGLSERGEWEVPFMGAFNFESVSDKRIKDILRHFSPDLRPVFLTQFKRQLYRYAGGHGETGFDVEIAIDSGEIICGDQRCPISEIELELTEGKPACLWLIAKALATTVPVLPDARSKAERGYGLVRREPISSQTAGTIQLDKTDTPVEAFYRIAMDCIHQWQTNALLAVEDRWSACIDDSGPAERLIDVVHQFRVSQRRLRSALNIFGPILAKPWRKKWRKEIRKNTIKLGLTRDLDVVENSLLPVLSSTDNENRERLIKLKQALDNERIKACLNAEEHLAAADQGRCIIDFVVDLESVLKGDFDVGPGVAAFAAKRLDRLVKDVKKTFENSILIEPETLHELRIAGKQLRYGVEFFSSLFTEMKAYRKRLTRLQNKLGRLHDIDMAEARLFAIAGDDPVLREAAAYVVGWYRRDYEKIARGALDDCAKLLKTPVPWREAER